jgi:hypothetical protein
LYPSKYGKNRLTPESGSIRITYDQTVQADARIIRGIFEQWLQQLGGVEFENDTEQSFKTLKNDWLSVNGISYLAT